MKSLAFSLLLLAALTSGCERNQPAQTSSAPEPATSAPAPQVAPAQPGFDGARQLFSHSIEPELFELPTDVLPRWRQSAETKPTLALLSFDPFLQPLRPELRSAALDLAKAGSAADLLAKGRIFRAEPALLPNQALSAAVEAGFFSRLCWIFPSTVKPEDLTLELFRKQMLEADFLTEQETAKLQLADGIYSGSVRGIPFQAIHAWALPKLEGPLLLHIDLSYFKGLYKDNVTTPIYHLLHQTATGLRAAGWNPQAVTLSFSTEEGEVSLDTRFLLRDLATLLRQPEILDGEPPAHWNQRAEAFSGVEVYTPEKMLELVEKEVKLAPDDPSVHYDHYTTLLETKKIDAALAALDKAVSGDPGYAYAYAELAQVAIKDRNAQAAVDLLTKAAARYQGNPFIPLQLADVHINTGKPKEALALLEPLKKLAWSKLYHDDIPALLERMTKDAQALQAKGAK